MGIPWEYDKNFGECHRNTLGTLWEYDGIHYGESMATLWEYSGNAMVMLWWTNRDPGKQLLSTQNSSMTHTDKP